MYPNNGVIEVIEDYQILTVAWQWVGEHQVYCVGQDDFIGYIAGENDDTSIVKHIWKLLDECDYAVAHNGDSFDVKKANARMMIRGLPPPSPYKQIDTKKIAKRVGGFTSNRLKHLANDLKVNQKGDPGGFGTWKGCLDGNPKAWKKMKKYNKQDIPPLMDLYLKFRPWDKQGAPMNLLEGKPESCPKCGKGPIQKRGTYPTKVNIIQRVWCLNCHGWSHQRINPSGERPLYVS
jgi:hypothetical protein